MPEPVPGGGRRRVSTGTPRWFRNLARLLMLGLFLLASGALIYGILTILKKQPPVEAPQHAPPAAGLKSPPAPAAEEEQAPPLPDGLEPVSPWKEAEATLEKFLTAKTLAERLHIIETKTSPEDLAASCLASALPPVRKMVPEQRETNPIERVVDFYYTVEFDAADRPEQTYTLLVRTRGSSPPRVVADPFLDTYGGRLAAYAATPSDKGGVFQVVVYAVASCTDPNIPEREKKLTLKLLSADNTKEIARAYFGRQSKISEMLEDGNYSLSYGSAKACTVMLRWNTEDNPEHPFLEAIAIKDLDWNS